MRTGGGAAAAAAGEAQKFTTAIELFPGLSSKEEELAGIFAEVQARGLQQCAPHARRRRHSPPTARAVARRPTTATRRACARPAVRH